MEALGMERAVLANRGDLLQGRVSHLGGKSGSEPEVVAREMESLFATVLVKEMRKGLGEGFFGSGPGADTFAGWFDEQLGASIASRGSLGLADTVAEALVRQRAAEAAAEQEDA